MDLVTLADVRDAARASAERGALAKSTWQNVEARLNQAASGGGTIEDTTEVWAALQMVLMLENVEYRLK